MTTAASPIPTPTSPRRIGQIAIVVHDVARATAFYRDTLGLPLLFEVPGMSFLDCGGVRLMLARAETPEHERASSILYYDVADLDGAHARLRAAGVHFEDEPHRVATLATGELWMTFCRDSEGNLLALMAERAAV